MLEQQREQRNRDKLNALSSPDKVYLAEEAQREAERRRAADDAAAIDREWSARCAGFGSFLEMQAFGMARVRFPTGYQLLEQRHRGEIAALQLAGAIHSAAALASALDLWLDDVGRHE